MEQIPLDVDPIVAEQPDELPEHRYLRLRNIAEAVVAAHRRKLDSFAPDVPPRFGIDSEVDAGRVAVWKLDAALLELEEQGRGPVDPR